jgi:hypothetical protein
MSTMICWICGKALALQERKSDDRGRPMHENCYMAIVLGETRTAFTPTQKASSLEMICVRAKIGLRTKRNPAADFASPRHTDDV